MAPRLLSLFMVSFMSVLGLFPILTTADQAQAFQEWVAVPQMDCADLMRFDAEYFPATGMIYILGGRYGGETRGNIYAFDPVTRTCSDTGAVLTTPVSNYTISLANDGVSDLLYVFGGRDSAGNRTASVQCYNPVTNQAFVKTSLPLTFADYSNGYGQVTLNNKVYLFGGFNVTDMTAMTYRFDPVTNGFTRLSDLSLARAYIYAAVVDGKIFALGGDEYISYNLVASDRVEVMADPEGAATWDDGCAPDLPTPLGEGRALGIDFNRSPIFGGKILLVGGGVWPSESNMVLSFDTKTGIYDDAVPDLNVARRNHAAALALVPEPTLWVFGGRTLSDAPPHAQPEYFKLNILVGPAVNLLLLE